MLTPATPRMNLEGIMLREDGFRLIPHKGGTWSNQSRRDRVAWWLSGTGGGGGERNGDQCLMGTEFQFGEHEEVLETDGGDGMYFMPLHWALKNG